MSITGYGCGNGHVFVFAGGKIPDTWKCLCGATNYKSALPAADSDPRVRRLVEAARAAEGLIGLTPALANGPTHHELRAALAAFDPADGGRDA